MLVPKRSPPQPGREESPVRLHTHREGLCSQYPRPQLRPPAPSLCRRPADWVSVLHSVFRRSRPDGTFARRLGRLSTPGRNRGRHQSLGPAIVVKTLQARFQLEERTEPRGEQLGLLSHGAPGAVSLCTGLQGGGRAARESLRGAEHSVRPETRRPARPRPSTPTRNQGDGQALAPPTRTQQEPRSPAPHSWHDLCVTSRPLLQKGPCATATRKRKDQGRGGKLCHGPAHNRRPSLPPRRGQWAGLWPDISSCRPARPLSGNPVPLAALSPGDHRDCPALSSPPPTQGPTQPCPHRAVHTPGQLSHAGVRSAQTASLLGGAALLTRMSRLERQPDTHPGETLGGGNQHRALRSGRP